MNYAQKVQELLKMPQELCNMCGLCCKLASFKGGMSHEDIKKIAQDYSEPTQADGAKDFLTIFEQIPREEAENISSAFVKEVCRRFDEKKESVSFFKCRFIGPDGRCLIHEDRPLLCRMYPIPHERTVYHENCGFKDCGEKNWQEIKNIILELQAKSQQLEQEKQSIAGEKAEENT